MTLIVQLEFGPMVPLLRTTDVPPPLAVTEPPQVLFRFTGLARKTLAGRLSVSETWVKVLPCSLFVITMESWLVCPAHIVLELKLLLIEGTGLPVTFKVALAGVVFVMFVPPPVDVSSPAGIVLMRFPTVVDVTLIDTVHDPRVVPDWAGTVPPLKDKAVPPAGALTEPPQELVKPTGLAIVRPG